MPPSPQNKNRTQAMGCGEGRREVPEYVKEEGNFI